MAYQALYRKYRPASFDEVVGQKQIVQTLRNAVERDRIGHAYLFCGPRGTGKTSIAKIFARTLNCTGEHKPCMECDNCKASLNGSHPDIIEIDAASNNGVDEVRSLIERVGYAPMEGRYKVYIIDEVHMMTTGAFNALLKTIEEPPAHVIFIFATTEPDKVLPTILSRCQRFDFSKVSTDDIADRLNTVCQSEGIELTEGAARQIAVLSDGGMRDSLSILDQCIAYSPDRVDETTVREVYGIAQLSDIGEIFSSLQKKNAEDALKKLGRIEADGFDLKRFVSDFIRLLKNSLLYDLQPDTLLIQEDEKSVLKDHMSTAPARMRIRLLNRLMDFYNKLNFASNVMDYIQTILLETLYESQIEIIKSVSVIQQKTPVQSEKAPEFINKTVQKTKKLAKQAQKSSLGSMFWNSDVSRETLYSRSDSDNSENVNEEILLGLLTGAEKSERAKDSESLKKVTDYLSDVDYAKLALSLKTAQIVASGDNYILLSSPGPMQAAEIREIESQTGYASFLSLVLGKPKKVFVITFSEQKALIQAFRERSKNGTLPAPYKVESIGSAEQSEDQESFLKTIFPDLIVSQD